MNNLLPVLLPAAAAAMLMPVIRRFYPDQIGSHPVYWLLWVLPFAAGGFHTYISPLVCLILLGCLVVHTRKSGQFRLFLNWNSAAVAAVVIGYCLSPFWGADRGMAAFGFARSIPLLLAMLVMMQLPSRDNRNALDLLPVCGAVMTGVSLAILWIPGMEDYVTVNGRLSGFMQYPNTFAVFLLAGLAWNGLKPQRTPADPVVEGVLVLGLFLSGSRTAFVILVLLAAVILILRKNRQANFTFLGILALALGISVVISGFGVLTEGDRFTSISVSSGTFLARLLYFRDALGLIAAHPFGIGYWGYRAMLGSIQTGRYAVSYVHNGFLQLMLDVGWVPAALAAFAFLRTVFRRQPEPRVRILYLVILSHCMLDFDLQFLSIWMILLLGLDWHSGRAWTVGSGRHLLLTAGAVMTAISLWLGIGDGLYQSGNLNGCLTVTPFHTEALATSLTHTAEPEELLDTAEQILLLNPQASIAHSARANALLAKGDVAGMIGSKQLAIQSARYSTEDYCDYISKLYAVYQLYLNAGDHASAQYCARLLGEVPQMIHAVEESSSSLAHLTGENPTIELPEEYQQLLSYFASKE